MEEVSEESKNITLLTYTVRTVLVGVYGDSNDIMPLWSLPDLPPTHKVVHHGRYAKHVYQNVMSLFWEQPGQNERYVMWSIKKRNQNILKCVCFTGDTVQVLNCLRYYIMERVSLYITTLYPTYHR